MRSLVQRLHEAAPDGLLAAHVSDLPAVREAAGRIMALETAMVMIEGVINKASTDCIEHPDACLARIQELVRIAVPDVHKHIRSRY